MHDHHTRELNTDFTKPKGWIMDIQPFSVNDGDGIRTTVFLAGCPLRCRWCSNPEGFACRELVGWYMRKCIGCGACSAVCPQGIGIDLNAGRDKCVTCGACVSVCPAGARDYMVRLMDASDVLREIQRHRLFYSQSGGGVTFSGGEATQQQDLLRYLTRELYDMGYSLDIETSGYFDFDRVSDILRRMDLVFMDLKIFDDERHQLYTSVSNKKILANIARLSELPCEKVIRIPVIGGVNDSEDNIRASARYVHTVLPEARMELLPYHELGRIKYEAAGVPYSPEIPDSIKLSSAVEPASIPAVFTRPSEEQMEHLRSIIREECVTLADFR